MRGLVTLYTLAWVIVSAVAYDLYGGYERIMVSLVLAFLFPALAQLLTDEEQFYNAYRSES